jgi:hypothetical protein
MCSYKTQFRVKFTHLFAEVHGHLHTVITGVLQQEDEHLQSNNLNQQ